MREDQIDQAERRATLDNDLKVLQERGSTYHQHGLAGADEVNQGRFRATGTPHVVGQSAVPIYPQAATAFQRDPVPDEPSLGVEINRLTPFELEPSLSSLPPAQVTGGADGAPSPPDVEHTAPPSSLPQDQTNG
jgi:hypothetical protein